MFSSTIAIQDKEGFNEFQEIQKKVLDSLNYTKNHIELPNSLNYGDIITKISSDNIRQYNPNEIIKKISLEKIIGYIPEFTAEILDDLRHILLTIDYNELSEDTEASIMKFKDEISLLLQKEDIDLDCIKRLQLSWICNAVERDIEERDDKRKL